VNDGCEFSLNRNKLYRKWIGN